MSDKERLENLKADLKKLVEDPQISMTLDEFYGHPETYRGLVVSAESGNTIQGIRIADYWEDYVSPEFEAFLKEHRASFEYYDAGTLHVCFDE